MPLTRQLVEQDKVFAIFNSLGTESNLAVRPYLNADEGAAAVRRAPARRPGGATTRQYPYTIGFQPSYQAEGWVYGKYLARTAPGATIAVLFQNDDYGKDLLGGLKRGLQRSKAKVIAAQPYDVDRGRRLVADREAEGVRRRHARDLRDADLRDPGVLRPRTSSAGSRSA